MSKITLSYSIGTSETIEVGSYEHNADNANEAFIKKVLNKSIKGLCKDHNKFISGIITVFVDRVHTYDVVFMGDPKGIIKPKYYKS